MHRAGDMIRSSFIPGRGCPGIASVHAMACRAPKVRCAGLSIAIPVCPNHQDVDGAIVRLIDKGDRAAFGKRESCSTEVAWPHREVLSRAGAGIAIAGCEATANQKSSNQDKQDKSSQLLHKDFILSRKRAVAWCGNRSIPRFLPAWQPGVKNQRCPQHQVFCAYMPAFLCHLYALQ